MKASELIYQLRLLAVNLGSDPEVLVQSACCSHGHEIDRVAAGEPTFNGVLTEDEVGSIVIRADA